MSLCLSRCKLPDIPELSLHRIHIHKNHKFGYDPLNYPDDPLFDNEWLRCHPHTQLERVRQHLEF
jgi:hypothetical protein